MVIEPHMKQGRQHKLISTIFLATSVTKKLDHNSISQYLILLPTVTAEKGEMVLKRIITNFRKLYNRKDITVEMRLQPILPWKNVPLKETLEYGEMTPETDETI